MGQRLEKRQKDKEEEKKKEKKAPSKQPTKKASPALQAIVNEKEISHPEMIKRVWDYIKSKNLQNPKNKRQIIPDAALAKVLGTKEPVDMMKLSRLLGKHLS